MKENLHTIECWKTEIIERFDGGALYYLSQKQMQEVQSYRTTFAVSSHSSCKLSQGSTLIQDELSVASLAISTRWLASIKPFFL